jgi:hypothetical protein
MPTLKTVDAKSQGTAENLANYRPLDEYVFLQGTSRQAQVLLNCISCRGAIPTNTFQHMATLSSEIAFMHITY